MQTCPHCGLEHATQEELDSEKKEVNPDRTYTSEGDLATQEKIDPDEPDVSKVEDELPETEVCEKKSVVCEPYKDPE
jgi:hypothetical protein